MSIRLIIVFILIFSSKVHSKELFDTYRSVRGMAMGGAYTSVAQGIDSLFYNPASLADVKGFNLNLLNASAAATEADDTILNSLEGLTESSTIGQSLQDLYGNPLSGSVGGRFGLTLPSFGLAGFAHSDLSLTVNNPVIPDLDVSSILDAGVAIGFAKRPNKFMNFGVVLKQVTRYGDRRKFTAASVSTLDPQLITDALDKKGTGYGLDAGLDIVFRGKNLTYKSSIVAKDIGDTSFHKNNNTFGPPPTQKFELIHSESLIYDVGFASLTLAADYRHALKEEVSLARKLHLGLELSLPLIDLRAGLNQGYMTYGAGINLGIFRVDATSYGVEIGERAGQQEDRRYMVQLSFDFGFEFTSNKGSGSGVSFQGAGRNGEMTLSSGGGRRAYKRKYYKHYRKQRR